LHLTLLRWWRRWLHLTLLRWRRWRLHLTLLRWWWGRLHLTLLWRWRRWLHLTLLWRWGWLHLTLLRRRRRWLHLPLLWRRARSLWRFFLLFLFRLGCLGDHERTIEWRGVCWTKRHSPQDQADQQPLFCVGHTLTMLLRCKKETSADESVPTGAGMCEQTERACLYQELRSLMKFFAGRGTANMH
jgi:hypothetical protein